MQINIISLIIKTKTLYFYCGLEHFNLEMLC